ncbi:TPA: hypothetical protein HA231_01070 [Candidatus Woesearchaeota archaeon]|nr:hypothetical protein [Candidatus Woesearchaeota archaeon]
MKKWDVPVIFPYALAVITITAATVALLNQGSEPVCGNGLIEKGEAPQNCCEDTGCLTNQECTNHSCIDLKCRKCEYAAYNQCGRYECCSDTECGKNETCGGNTNKCVQIECECGYIKNRVCINYECCDSSECPAGICQNNKCAAVEKNAEETAEEKQLSRSQADAKYKSAGAENKQDSTRAQEPKVESKANKNQESQNQQQGNQAAAPDLGVLYIERTPKYERYRVTYFSDRHFCSPEYAGYYPYEDDRGPQLCPGESGKQRWPKEGETVTFTAYIKNHGKGPSGIFSFRWLIDGVEVSSGTQESLSPGQATKQTIKWTWPAHLSDHTVRFVVDPENMIQEPSENNNMLEDFTNALSFRIHVAKSVYDKFNAYQNMAESYSFEDWIQSQARTMNEKFVDSIYPAVAPNGILERIRIDEIVVENDNELFFDSGEHAPPDFYQDSRWGFSVKEWMNDASKIERMSKGIDWALIHEWGHQLGLIDEYSLDVAKNNVLVTDGNNQLVSGTSLLPDASWCTPRPDCPVHYFKFAGNAMMHGPGNVLFSEHSAAALNLHLHKRRGYFGDYLFDVPSSNSLKIVGTDGTQVEGVSVTVYQRREDGTIPDSAVFFGLTNKAGIFDLPNVDGVWSSGDDTATGHRLRPNPFGKIAVTGSTGTFLIKLSKGSEEYKWLEITDFNLAYWKGEKEQGMFEVKTRLQ